MRRRARILVCIITSISTYCPSSKWQSLPMKLNFYIFTSSRFIALHFMWYTYFLHECSTLHCSWLEVSYPLSRYRKNYEYVVHSNWSVRGRVQLVISSPQLMDFFSSPHFLFPIFKMTICAGISTGHLCPSFHHHENVLNFSQKYDHQENVS